MTSKIFLRCYGTKCIFGKNDGVTPADERRAVLRILNEYVTRHCVTVFGRCVVNGMSSAHLPLPLVC